MTNYINGVLGRLGLSLNQDKTSVVDLKLAGERLDFLSFTSRFDRSDYGDRRYLKTVPKVRSMNRVR